MPGEDRQGWSEGGVLHEIMKLNEVTRDSCTSVWQDIEVDPDCRYGLRPLRECIIPFLHHKFSFRTANATISPGGKRLHSSNFYYLGFKDEISSLPALLLLVNVRLFST